MFLYDVSKSLQSGVPPHWYDIWKIILLTKLNRLSQDSLEFQYLDIFDIIFGLSAHFTM